MIWAATAKDEDRKCARRHVIVVAGAAVQHIDRTRYSDYDCKCDVSVHHFLFGFSFVCLLFTTYSKLSHSILDAHFSAARRAHVTHKIGRYCRSFVLCFFFCVLIYFLSVLFLNNIYSSGDFDLVFSTLRV